MSTFLSPSLSNLVCREFTVLVLTGTQTKVSGSRRKVKWCGYGCVDGGWVVEPLERGHVPSVGPTPMELSRSED